MVFQIFAALTRARELIWGPVFGHFPEKCERFVIFCNIALKKLEVRSLNFLFNNFLFAVWGVRGGGEAAGPGEPPVRYGCSPGPVPRPPLT